MAVIDVDLASFCAVVSLGARETLASRALSLRRAARWRGHLENNADELSVVQVLRQRAQKLERDDAKNAARAAATGAASCPWPSRRERAGSAREE